MTKEQRSRAMKAVRLRNGPLEERVKRELRSIGARCRYHSSSLPGRPDIILPKHRMVIFVDGDFWHGWRLPAWEHKLSPFWREKLRSNRARDRRNFRRLRARGWTVLRIWEHQIEDEDRLRFIIEGLKRRIVSSSRVSRP